MAKQPPKAQRGQPELQAGPTAESSDDCAGRRDGGHPGDLTAPTDDLLEAVQAVTRKAGKSEKKENNEQKDFQHSKGGAGKEGKEINTKLGMNVKPRSSESSDVTCSARRSVAKKAGDSGDVVAVPSVPCNDASPVPGPAVQTYLQAVEIAAG
eukprot:866849-Lingulodinium_polyedra.AAC.1